MSEDKRHLATGSRNPSYREAARRLFPNVTIEIGAAVFPLADGGAYVEGIVFVPESAVDLKKESGS